MYNEHSTLSYIGFVLIDDKLMTNQDAKIVKKPESFKNYVCYHLHILL